MQTTQVLRLSLTSCHAQSAALTQSTLIFQQNNALDGSGSSRLPLHALKSRPRCQACHSNLRNPANKRRKLSTVNVAPQPPLGIHFPAAATTDTDTLQQLLRYPTLFDPVRTPRLPIVLCHGLFGFDTFGIGLLPQYQIHYWNAVLDILKKKFGAKVLVTAVPSSGSIKDRAEKLHQTLYAEMHSQDLNLLAHSMGGLDARWLLSHIRPVAYNPVSLTTLSTPHRGSDFMSWCQANIGVGTPRDPPSTPAQVLKDIKNLPYSLSEPILSRSNGDKPKKEKGIFPGIGSALSGYLLRLLDSPAYSNLTPAFLNDFNSNTPDRDDVQYFSVAAKASSLGVWHPLWLPKLILDAADAKRAQALGTDPSAGNDGLVPIESAKWGKFLGVVDNCDHWELRGAAGLRNAKEAVKHEASLSEEQLSSRRGLTEVYERLGEIEARKSETRDATDKSASNGDWTTGAAKIASWISKRIPFAKEGSTEDAGKNPVALPYRIEERLRFTSSKTPQPGRYNLEGLYAALCRNLYDNGM